MSRWILLFALLQVLRAQHVSLGASIEDEGVEMTTNERSRQTLHGILSKVQEKLPSKITSDGLESRPELLKSLYKRKTQAQQKEEYLLKKGKGGSGQKETRF